MRLCIGRGFIKIDESKRKVELCGFVPWFSVVLFLVMLRMVHHLRGEPDIAGQLAVGLTGFVGVQIFLARQFYKLLFLTVEHRLAAE